METFADRMHGIYHAFEQRAPHMLDTYDEIAEHAESRFSLAEDDPAELARVEAADDRAARERAHEFLTSYHETHRETRLALFRLAQRHGVRPA